MIINIKKEGHVMRTVSNGGHQYSRYSGLYPGFSRVWYNRKLLMDIMALNDVTKIFRVTMDSGVEAVMNVHVGEGRVLKCMEVTSGLYLFRLMSRNKIINEHVNVFILNFN